MNVVARFLSVTTVLCLTALTASGCAAHSNGESEESATGEDALGGISCSKRDAAMRVLETKGFVKTGAFEAPYASPGPGWHDVHYIYVPEYRYEHADGRVQYATCAVGRFGPAFPVKNVPLTVSGSWTGHTRSGSLLTPTAGTATITLQDFVYSGGPEGPALAVDVAIKTPLEAREQRQVHCPGNPSFNCPEWKQVPIELNARLNFTFDPETGIANAAQAVGENSAVSFVLTFDATGKPTSVKASAGQRYGDEWSFKK